MFLLFWQCLVCRNFCWEINKNISGEANKCVTQVLGGGKEPYFATSILRLGKANEDATLRRPSASRSLPQLIYTIIKLYFQSCEGRLRNSQKHIHTLQCSNVKEVKTVKKWMSTWELSSLMTNIIRLQGLLWRSYGVKLQVLGVKTQFAHMSQVWAHSRRSTYAQEVSETNMRVCAF